MIARRLRLARLACEHSVAQRACGVTAGAWHASAVTAAAEPAMSSPARLTADAADLAASSPAIPREDDASLPAERVFSVSVVVSGVRCMLAYVVFPWVLPAAGIASGVGSGLGLAIGAVAIVFNVLSIRRFQRADHRYRWPITLLNAGIIVLLCVLMVIDLGDLAG